MKLSFRPAAETDTSVISQLGHKIWHEHYPSIITVAQIDFMLNDRYSTQAIKEGMKRGEKYFVAFDGDTPVALADFELKGDHYFIHKFYVDVSNHRKGIGEKLFSYIISSMAISKPLRLQVNRLNYKAINFYFKMGFVIERVGDFDIGGGYFMNDYVMIKRA